MKQSFRHLKGVIIEGVSNSGKSSTLQAIRHSAGIIPQKSLIILGEHYSQIRHKRNDSIEFSTAKEHHELLAKKLEMLVNLGEWGDFLGDYRPESRGVFYVFERFHLNHSQYFPKSDLTEIERSLARCNAKTILLTVSEKELKRRIGYRHPHFSQGEVARKTDELVSVQNELISLSVDSQISTRIIDSDEMNWKKYAQISMNLD